MKKKTPAKRQESLPRHIPFINLKGDTIHIPASHTIDDLLAMGIKEIRLERRGSFLPDGWYKNKFPSEPKTKTTKRKEK